MVTTRGSAGQEAPPQLEPVRVLLNSWLIPNDSRQPADRFGELAAERGWAPGQAGVVRELRDDLRPMTESGRIDAATLNTWIKRAGLRPAIALPASVAVRAAAESAAATGLAPGAGPSADAGRDLGAGDPADRIVYHHHGGPAGDILAAVIGSIGAGTWERLKACPDCHWVFYDRTRNGSKRWCLMYAGGPEGRACGTIAKVRRYRDRQAAAASV